MYENTADMPRVRVNISIDEKLLERLDKYIESTYQYSDRSTFIEFAINQELEKQERE